MAGHYTYGHEVNVFQPCGSSQVYWVGAPDSLMADLKAMHRELTKGPYEPVFVRLAGSLGEVPLKALDGFPGEYDGWLTVRVVQEIREVSATEWSWCTR